MSTSAMIRALVRRAYPVLDETVLLSNAASGDRAEFAELARRHGPMVLGVCRRVLGTSADADDAFQTTFLALMEHVHDLRTPTALPAWLHRTAFRAAVKLKARRSVDTAAVEPAIHPEPLADLSWKEVRGMLDEELNSLPERFRAPLVLCYLDGRTRDDVAAALGLSLSTLKRRLAAGLDRLNRRLTRRGVDGVALAAAALGGVGGTSLAVEVPTALAQRLPAAFDARLATALGTTSFVAWKAASISVLMCGLAVAGMTLVSSGNPAKAPPMNPALPPSTSKAPADAGVPLPEGAVVRLGSVLFRHAGLGDFALLLDGKSVITSGSDHFLHTWDLATGREVRNLRVASNVPQRGCLSRDGRFAAGFVGKNITVFDTATGKEKAAFEAPGKDFHSTFFSPDGKTLAVLTWEPRLTLVDVATNKLRELPLPKRTIGMDSTFHGGFSPDGRWIAAGGGSGDSLCVFDMASGVLKHRLDCSASCSTITPDGKTLVVCAVKPKGEGCEIMKFDLDSGKETTRFDFGKRDCFYTLDISPDGKTLAGGFSDFSCIMDLASGRIVYELSNRPIGVKFTRDGKHLVASTGHKLRVWNTADGKELFDNPGDLGFIPVLTVSADGRWLASADWLDRGVSMWDLSSGRLRILPFRSDEGRYVRQLGFSPDGRTLWAGGYMGFVQWWDPATGKELRTVQLKSTTPNPDYLYRVRVTPDGKTASALARVNPSPEATSLVLWDIASGRLNEERQLPAEQREWAWTWDGAAVALPTADGLVVADGTNPSRTRFTIPEVAANAPIAFSPDGRLLAAQKTTGAVIIIEVATGSVATVVNTGPVKYVALTDGGRTLVAARGRDLKVFDTATGRECLHRLLPGKANALILTSERRALTALEDGTGLVWNLPAPAMQPKASAESTTKFWDALLERNAAIAYKAVWNLADRPSEAVALLRDKLKPVLPADAAVVKALIAKLDAPDFAEREAASKALQTLGVTAAAALKSALEGKPSAEQAARIQRLLTAVNKLQGVPLREVRAIAALERIGSTEARKLLDELARGVPEAHLTMAATAAVARLTGRSE